MEPAHTENDAPMAGSGGRLIARLLFPTLVVAYLAAFGVSTRGLSFEARAFPLIMGGVALLVTLSIAATELREWADARSRAPRPPRSPSLGELWSVGRAGVLATILTALLIPASTWFGFFVALPFFLLVLLLLLGVRPWWVAVLTALAYLGVTYFFFDILMGLRLPTGG